MLGLLYFSIIIIIGISTYLKNKSIDMENKANFRIDGTNLYYDHNMCPRDINTNKKMLYYRNMVGDRIVRDAKGKRSINLSRNERLRDIEAKRNDAKCNEFAICIDKDNGLKHSDKAYIKGNKYIGLDDGKIYVKRYFNRCLFWVDVETRRAARLFEMGRHTKNMNQLQKQKLDEYNSYLQETDAINSFIPSSEYR